MIVNLTVPSAHVEVALKALSKGKSVYSEKPLALSMDEGRQIVALAREKGLLAGCAPDTFMGPGLQTCRKIIDEGVIGAPVAAAAFMMCGGHESWHPAPEFYYKPGGGPLFDMGPYYLTALVNFFGPVKRVTGMAKTSFPERKITSSEKYGEVIKVEVPTHITGLLEFENGAHASLTTSFDVPAHELPKMEIYGEEGTLSVPDPNTFGGPVRLRRSSEKEWREVPPAFGGAGRGTGAADMARALMTGRPHRARAETGLHVLEIMNAVIEASRSGKRLELETSCSRPAPLPEGLGEGELD